MSDFNAATTVTTCHHLFPLHRMWGMERAWIHIPIWEERKLALEVVTVVTELISFGFFCHHLTGEVVTKAQVVTNQVTSGSLL